jgi:hypothetical protein
MTNPPFIAKTLPIAALISLVLTWQIDARTGDETFLCDGASCELGSGLSWLLTGAALIGPFIAVLGAAWTRRLHQRDRLGPFSSRGVPDGEQIVEVLAVLAAGLATFWLLRNGPMIDAVEVGRPNSWILDAREFSDEFTSNPLVPNRTNWFMMGAVLGAPFAFSLGSMIAREWYGRRRRRTELDEDYATDEVDIGLASTDPTDPATQLPIDDR